MDSADKLLLILLLVFFAGVPLCMLMTLLIWHLERKFESHYGKNDGCIDNINDDDNSQVRESVSMSMPSSLHQIPARPFSDNVFVVSESSGATYNFNLPPPPPPLPPFNHHPAPSSSSNYYDGFFLLSSPPRIQNNNPPSVLIASASSQGGADRAASSGSSSPDSVFFHSPRRDSDMVPPSRPITSGPSQGGRPTAPFSREGLDQNTIDSMPTAPVGGSVLDENSDMRCPICLSIYSKDEIVRRLPCLHAFHVGCIDDWLKRKSECPLCKQNPRDLLQQS